MQSGSLLGDEGTHADRVDGWLERITADQTPDALLRTFDAALEALWVRTNDTLGEVTLTAIADRVVHNAAKKFPLFVALKVDPSSGIECGALHERVNAGNVQQVRLGIRFVLVEFLTVLGNLTADLLTPQLHQALDQVKGPKARSKKTPHAGDTTP